LSRRRVGRVGARQSARHGESKSILLETSDLSKGKAAPTGAGFRAVS
jgi:hypothetical protein